MPRHLVAGGRAPEGDKSFITTLVLSLFLGFVGADRFYLGKTGTALLKMVTFGGWGLWWLVDVVLTISGNQRDSLGFRLDGFEEHKRTVWKITGAVFAAVILVSLVLDPSGSGYGLSTFGWVVAGVAAVLGTVWGLRTYRRRKALDSETSDDPLPGPVRAQVDRIHHLRSMYRPLASAGNEAASAVLTQMDALVKNLPELFRRLARKSDAEQWGFARAEYADKLTRLAAALDRPYMVDLIVNPHLWNNPELHFRGVQSAIEAVNAQVLDNIRSVNSVGALEFQVSLDGLDGVERLGGFVTNPE